VVTSHAIQIDYRVAEIPPPTKKMMESAGLAAFNLMRSRVDVHLGSETAEWDEVHPWIREAWIDSARVMYGVIAIHGGAAIKDLDEENMNKKLKENEE
jgi:hypothetical protein